MISIWSIWYSYHISFVGFFSFNFPNLFLVLRIDQSFLLLKICILYLFIKSVFFSNFSQPHIFYCCSLYHHPCPLICLLYQLFQYLIISDSQSCLLSLQSNLFNPSTEPLTLLIKFQIYRLSFHHIIVDFILMSNHVNILGNEIVDTLVIATTNIIIIFLLKIPISDLVRSHHKILKMARSDSWSSLCFIAQIHLFYNS